MRKHGRYTKRLDLWMDENLHAALQAAAARRRVSVATLVRDLLTLALAEEAAIEGRDALDRAIRRAIKPTEDRLASLVCKAVVTAATAMYMNTQALADLGARDVLELYQQARKKAVAYLREKTPTLEEGVVDE